MTSTALSSSSVKTENLAKIPGHWLLARLGKRVLRPGGLELTRDLLAALAISATDDVVELAPGLGVTAQLVLQASPASYTGVDRDETAAAQVRRVLTGTNRRCTIGDAEATGLPEQSASVVLGEAMLSMHGPEQKAAIVREAFRLLRPGGRYGIHELAFTPDDVGAEVRRAVTGDLSDSVRVGARPLAEREWRTLLASAGFDVRLVRTAPMHLLEPGRLISDEGLLRTLRFIYNVIRTPEARRRVSRMRSVFRANQAHLRAIMLVAHKPPHPS